jgi:hypothetical protein
MGSKGLGAGCYNPELATHDGENSVAAFVQLHIPGLT